jgi:hypothetical protein
MNGCIEKVAKSMPTGEQKFSSRVFRDFHCADPGAWV